MPQRREIRSYDYVNHPYARVREALTADPGAVFKSATVAAASRAQSVAAELHTEIAGVKVGAEIALSIGKIEESGRAGQASTVTRIPIEWEAARRPQLFPLMNGELSIYPLTPTETQLDFLGRYEPPLGIVGGALDAVVGHRIAEASVDRFIKDVAHYLRQELSGE